MIYPFLYREREGERINIYIYVYIYMDMLLSEDVRSFWEACTLTFTPGVLELQEFTGGDARPNSTNGNSLLITGVNYISTYVHGSMTIPYSHYTFGILTYCPLYKPHNVRSQQRHSKLHVFLDSNQPKKNTSKLSSIVSQNAGIVPYFQPFFVDGFPLHMRYYCLIWQYIQVKKSGFPPARLVLLKVSRHLGLPRYLLLPTRKVDGLSDPAGL